MATFRWVRRRRAAAFRADRLVTAQVLADEVAKGDPLVFLDVRGRLAREATGVVPGSLEAELETRGTQRQGCAQGCVHRRLLQLPQ